MALSEIELRRGYTLTYDASVSITSCGSRLTITVDRVTLGPCAEDPLISPNYELEQKWWENVFAVNAHAFGTIDYPVSVIVPQIEKPQIVADHSFQPQRKSRGNFVVRLVIVASEGGSFTNLIKMRLGTSIRLWPGSKFKVNCGSTSLFRVNNFSGNAVVQITVHPSRLSQEN
jgi:hypothetical protein